MIKSKISEAKRNDLIKQCKRMSPGQRLIAFYNHSQLIMRIHQSGIKYRNNSTKNLENNG